MAFAYKSERGRDIFVDDQKYSYHQHGKNRIKTVVYWVCSERRQKSCKARLVTNYNNGDYAVVKQVNYLLYR